jgi:hypothetical protein
VTGHVFILAILGGVAVAQENAARFYPDDPLLREPPPRQVKDVAKRHVNDLFDFLDNSFAMPGRIEKPARERPRRALDANTLGEVPDSAWYTNRHFYHRMSIEALKRGPGNGTPPHPEGPWRVISAKSDGVTPGFVIEDQHKHRYLIKLDQPDNPELASAADVIGSKAFYALGYNTPENYVVHFRPDKLKISGGVMWRDSSGKRHPLTARALDEMLRPQPKGADGAYRALASRWVAGEPVGPFSYEGMRTDDPNDIIPHEDRRVLRGLRVFAAWLNHHDTRSINSMDSLVEENGVRHLKHYLIDFGSILGSDGAKTKPAWSGHQYTIDNKGMAAQMVTFGFLVPRWARTECPNLRGVGLFDSWSFDPDSWKPNYPNAAFLLMDREDAFWAAKQVAAFSDAEIRALVETGEYSDPRAAEWVAQCLIKRRDKIAEAYFAKVLPLDRFKVVAGRLLFEDLSASRGVGTPLEYSLSWGSGDRAGRVAPLPEAVDERIPPLRDDTEYLLATIRIAGAGPRSDHPVSVYLRRGQTGLEVVGVDRRLPDVTNAGYKAAKTPSRSGSPRGSTGAGL